jgi:outer membrane protein assembly factor BamB
MRIILAFPACLGMALALLPALAAGEDWPQFRGRDGQGHSAETGLPTVWSESENIAWKTPIPGLGWSSPVVHGKLVWLTTAIEESGSLRAVAIDRGTGAVVHDVEVFRKPDLGRVAQKNSHASPTPVLEGDRVYVHFGAHGTACLTSSGEIVWKTILQHDHRHGPAGSPVVWNDLLIVACDGADHQYVVALDKKTGTARWKQNRSGETAYSTPLVIQAGPVEQLVSVGGGAVMAYNPKSGSEIWRCRFDGQSSVPRPVFGGGLLYFCTGYWTPSLVALRVDGRGDVTHSHVVGRLHRSIPLTSSPLLHDGDLYMVSDQGAMTCVDAKSGHEHWHKRLGGEFSASPVLADGHIFLVSEDATTSVLAADREFKLLATNKLDGRAQASPAISDQAIYLRTDQHLYKIQQPNAEVAKSNAKPQRPKVK